MSQDKVVVYSVTMFGDSHPYTIDYVRSGGPLSNEKRFYYRADNALTSKWFKEKQSPEFAPKRLYVCGVAYYPPGVSQKNLSFKLQKLAKNLKEQQDELTDGMEKRVKIAKTNEDAYKIRVTHQENMIKLVKDFRHESKKISYAMIKKAEKGLVYKTGKDIRLRHFLPGCIIYVSTEPEEASTTKVLYAIQSPLKQMKKVGRFTMPYKSVEETVSKKIFGKPIIKVFSPLVLQEQQKLYVDEVKAKAQEIANSRGKELSDASDELVALCDKSKEMKEDIHKKLQAA